MSVSQAVFDPDLSKAVTDTQTLISLVNQLSAALIAARAVANTPDDLTTEDSAVNTLDTSVVAAIATAQAALNPVTPPAAS